MKVTFREGPLGHVVLDEAGKPIGMIKNRRPHGWSVRLDGFEFDLPERNPITGKTTGPYRVFPSFTKAKAFVERTLS